VEKALHWPYFSGHGDGDRNNIFLFVR